MLRLTSGKEKALLVAGGEGFVGGAEERSGFVENDGDGDIAEQAFEFPLVLEGMEEGAVFHFFEDFDGNAACDVDAAEGQDLQRKIPCFGAIDGGPEIQSIRADAAGLVQTAASNLWSRIGIRVFEGGMRDL